MDVGYTVLIYEYWRNVSFLSTVVYNQIFHFVPVCSKLFSLLHHFDKGVYLIPIMNYSPPGDQPHHCGIICKLHNGFALVCVGSQHSVLSST